MNIEWIEIMDIKGRNGNSVGKGIINAKRIGYIQRINEYENGVFCQMNACGPCVFGRGVLSFSGPYI